MQNLVILFHEMIPFLILQVAITPYFTWEENCYNNMKVNLDFCLAYPTFLDKRNQCLQFREDFHDSTDMEYIIQYHVLLLTKSFLRLSLSTKEQMIMRTYPYPNGQNRCIRLLCVLTGRKAFLCRFRFKRHKDWPVNVLDQNSSICFVGRISTAKTMGR